MATVDPHMKGHFLMSIRRILGSDLRAMVRHTYFPLSLTLKSTDSLPSFGLGILCSSGAVRFCFS